MVYDHIAYLRKVVETFSDFGDVNNCFHRVSSIAGLEEFLQNQSYAGNLILVAVDSQDGILGDGNRTDNFMDQPYYRFYILKRYDLHDFDAREAALEACKTTAKKIFFKYLKDKRSQKNGLYFLDFGRIPYITVGPLGDNYHGLEFSFTVVDSLWQTPPTLTEEENFTLE